MGEAAAAEIYKTRATGRAASVTQGGPKTARRFEPSQRHARVAPRRILYRNLAVLVVTAAARIMEEAARALRDTLQGPRLTLAQRLAREAERRKRLDEIRAAQAAADALQRARHEIEVFLDELRRRFEEEERHRRRRGSISLIAPFPMPLRPSRRRRTKNRAASRT